MGGVSGNIGESIKFAPTHCTAQHVLYRAICSMEEIVIDGILDNLEAMGYEQPLHAHYLSLDNILSWHLPVSRHACFP